MKAFRTPTSTARCGPAFTLVEMLVVIAIIAILTALLTPAAQSLMGISGRRGGMNVLSSVIEQARLRAVEKQNTVYIGFPLTATNPSTKFSSVLVFEFAPGFTPIGRWQRFPTGVYYEPSTNFPSAPASDSIPTSAIPSLEGEKLTSLYAIGFNRFGQMLRPEGASDGPVQIRIGEKADPQEDFIRDDNNYFELTIRPFTGRVTMQDRSAKK